MNNFTKIKMSNETPRYKTFKHLSLRKLTHEKHHKKINKLYYDNSQGTSQKIKEYSSFLVRKHTITAEDSIKRPDTQKCATKTYINCVP